MEESTLNMCLRYEARTVYAASSKRHLPVTLLTGFLGAGKTTLLRQILANKQQLRIAAAVNDFAAINIDAALVEDKRDTQRGVVALSNGCLCCSLADDLETTIGKLLNGDLSEFGANLSDVDYLVIESSGVADPLAVVELLERRYGRMTRARLDSVVCLCDTEALAFEIEAFEELENASERIRDCDGNNERECKEMSDGIDRKLTSAVALSQLQMSDVVILNKMDLVTEEQATKVEQWIREVAPLARFHRCTKGRVPLQHILDVELQRTGEGAVQHEVGMAPFALVPHSRQLLRQGETRARATGRSEEAKEALRRHRQHLGDDQFESVSFECKEKLSLAAVQELLSLPWEDGGLPDSVVRMKGFICLENFSESFTFHWSGRRRYDCVADPSRLSRVSSLVVIGRSFDREELRKRLEGCSASQRIEVDATVRERAVNECKALVESDGRFEWMGDNHGVCHFRLTGAKSSGMSAEEMQRMFGVDLCLLNESLARSVNGRSSRLFLLPPGDDDSGTLSWATGGKASFPALWPSLTAEAESLLAVHLAAVRQCKCGF